jgi:hypothetical protein
MPVDPMFDVAQALKRDRVVALGEDEGVQEAQGCLAVGLKDTTGVIFDRGLVLFGYFETKLRPLVMPVLLH